MVTAPQRCSRCSSVLEHGDRFCGTCGATQAPPPAPPELLCRSCGAALRPDDRFCSSCGAGVSVAAFSAATHPAPPPGVSVPSAPAPAPPASAPVAPLPPAPSPTPAVPAAPAPETSTERLPPRWLWPRTTWGQILFVAIVVVPLAVVVIGEGEFEPDMLIVPAAMLLLVLLWRGLWVLVTRGASRSVPAVSTPSSTASTEATTARVPGAAKAKGGGSNWWTALLVIGGAGLLLFLASGGNPAAGIVGTVLGAAGFAAMWLIVWRSTDADTKPREIRSPRPAIFGVVLLVILIGILRECGAEIAGLF